MINADMLNEAAKGLKNLEDFITRLDTGLVGVEKALTDLDLGVESSIEMGVDMVEGSEDVVAKTYSLTFSKNNSKWQLGVTTLFASSGNTRFSPILKCSRDMRIQSVSYLDQLLASMMDQAASITKAVEDAINALDAFAEAMPSSKAAEVEDIPEIIA